MVQAPPGAPDRLEVFTAAERPDLWDLAGAGQAFTGGARRVPGLRREEVAVLAGVSTEWYVCLEKGHISGVSDDVLDAVARALQLDEAERLHSD